MFLNTYKKDNELHDDFKSLRTQISLKASLSSCFLFYPFYVDSFHVIDILKKKEQSHASFK